LVLKSPIAIPDCIMDANIFDCGTNFLNLPIGFPLSSEYKAYLHLINQTESKYVKTITVHYDRQIQLDEAVLLYNLIIVMIGNLENRITDTFHAMNGLLFKLTIPPRK
jgi:hypothetical protein